MPKVVISARASHMVSPSLCVCCGGPPDTEIADAGYRHTKGRRGDPNMCTVKFPACSACMRHRAEESKLFGGSPVRAGSCEARGCFVDYVGWSGTTHTFLFDSPRFAMAFAEANRSQGRNVLSVDLAAPAPATSSSPRLGAILLAVALVIGGVCCLASMGGGAQDNTPRVYVTSQSAPAPVRVAPAAVVPPDAGHHRRHHHRGAP